MKVYQRYELASSLGVIAQSESDLVIVPGSRIGEAVLNQDLSSVSFNKARGLPNYVICGAHQAINIWNIHTKEQVLFPLTNPRNESRVSRLVHISSLNYLVAGYTNGSILIWDLKHVDSVVSFDGHTSEVTALLYDAFGKTTLFSGGKDCDIVCWDIINQSGVYRLKGHTGPITALQILHLEQGNSVLVSSSKDTFIKLWDLGLQHCFATLAGHNHEVWDFVLVRHNTRLVSFSSDAEVRVWDLQSPTENFNKGVGKRPSTLLQSASSTPVEFRFIGSIICNSSKRTLRATTINNFILQLTADSRLHIFKVLTPEETEQKVAKRIRKAKKNAETSELGPSLSEEIQLVSTIKIKGKLKNFSVMRLRNTSTTTLCYNIVFLFQNNLIEVHRLSLTDDLSHSRVDLEIQGEISRLGHRYEPKLVTIDHFNNSFMTLSSESVKLWDLHQNQLIKTAMDHLNEDGGKSSTFTSCVFVPGNRFAVVALTSGEIRIYSLMDGSSIERLPATELNGDLRIKLSSDKKSIATFNKGAPTQNVHEVKFWDFEFIENDAEKLTLTHARTLQLGEAVLDVTFSSNMLHLAVALLDCTVKIFYADTLKFYLTLYGHKLPVSSVDFSSDGTLVVTGGLDKNVKLWGIDFGDCHKSIFAHDQGVTCVKFVPQTHYFFSCGKDGRVRYWDGDTYDLLLTLEGHHGSVLWLDITTCGSKVVTCGTAKDICVWQRTDEQFVLDMEHEKQYDIEMEKAMMEKQSLVSHASETGRTTIETVKEAELLLELVELSVKEDNTPHSEKFRSQLVDAFRKIKQSQLEQCLSLLPHSYVCTFLKYLLEWLSTSVTDVERCSRSILFLFKLRVKIHHAFLLQKVPLEKIKTKVQQRLSELRDLVGFNVAAFNHFEHQRLNSCINRDQLLEKLSSKKQPRKNKRATLRVNAH